jgi:ribonuclease P protein component
MRAGSRAATRTVVVHAHASDASAGARAGFVVGRSVGGSVVRNRVTRQLRHIMAVQLEGLPVGTDVVVRALPPAAQASGAELGQDVSSGLRRAMARLGHEAGTPRTVSR